MGLSHLTPNTETVQTPKGETFTVRGLALPDIVAIFNADKAVLAKVFEDFAMTPDGQVVLGDMGAFAVALTEVAPTVVASIISAAADEPDLSIAARFSFPVQIDALEKIGRLTFTAEMPPKKLMETVIRLVQNATRLGAAKA